MSRPLYSQGKISWYPFDRLGGPQSRSGRGGEEKNSYTLPELELPIIHPIAQCYTAELSQLLNESKITVLNVVIYVLFDSHEH
jgi:hypothetical protein